MQLWWSPFLDFLDFHLQAWFIPLAAWTNPTITWSSSISCKTRQKTAFTNVLCRLLALLIISVSWNVTWDMKCLWTASSRCSFDGLGRGSPLQKEITHLVKNQKHTSTRLETELMLFFLLTRLKCRQYLSNAGISSVLRSTFCVKTIFSSSVNRKKFKYEYLTNRKALPWSYEELNWSFLSVSHKVRPCTFFFEIASLICVLFASTYEASECLQMLQKHKIKEHVLNRDTGELIKIRQANQNLLISEGLFHCVCSTSRSLSSSFPVGASMTLSAFLCNFTSIPFVKTWKKKN